MHTRTQTIVTGIIFMLMGLLSIAFPYYMSLGMEAFLGALFLVGGIFQLSGAFDHNRHPSYVWRFFTGVINILAGVYLLGQPLVGLQILTLIVIILFFTQGFLTLVYSLHIKEISSRWGWSLANGILTIFLSALLLMNYPSSSLWTLGLLVGVNLLTFGLTVFMLGSSMENDS